MKVISNKIIGDVVPGYFEEFIFNAHVLFIPEYSFL